MTVNKITIPPQDLPPWDEASRGTDYGQGWIETYPSGSQFNPKSLAPNFQIEDIAHSLGMCVRYNGHVKEFYSVAEHCVLVSHIMENEQGEAKAAPFEGLMHDALEAYLTDVPAPFKQFLPDYRKFDEDLEIKLRRHYEIGPKTTACKHADWIALFIEAFYLVKSGGRMFADPLNMRDIALTQLRQYPIHCWSPHEATRQFMMRFQELNHVA